MGGGTGTGAAPVVAEIAKRLGILTVAVVTRPFAFEGKRQKIAQTGIEELQKQVDSLIIIPNDKLIEVLGGKITRLEAYAAANDVLHNAVSGIAEIITNTGDVNVDFADVRTVMSEVGMAMMGSAIASGENRAMIAAEQAVRSPLLEDVNLAGARGILVNITSTSSFTMDEYYGVMNTIKGFTAEDATVIIGNVVDEAMGDQLRVTMVATGLGSARLKKESKPEIRVVERGSDRVVERTGTDNVGIEHINYEELDAPAVMRRGRREVNQTIAASIDTLEIPAFLRKQAD
jgi:cell division protein FtsZ